MDYQRYYFTMKDGTIKQLNPFTGTEVWTVPSRLNKPVTNVKPREIKAIEKKYPEDYCNFCPLKYANTPAEKARMVINNGQWQYQDTLLVSHVTAQPAEFRRVPNLFEIVSYDYWNKNYTYRLNNHQQEWKDRYLAEPAGLDQVLHMVDMKLKFSGKSDDEIRNISRDEKISIADSFFGGCHELIIARRHYLDGAEDDSQLCSSGDLSEEEHYHYLRFTIRALDDIRENNPYARFVSVFQNWLAPAGASFDHLHKQLVALDEWGVTVEKFVEHVRSNPNVFNELAVNFALYTNRVFLENDSAIAFVEIGARYPSMSIYSKSRNIMPSQHTEKELRDMSDMVRAIHRALGRNVSNNEEWYYTPFDVTRRMLPWFIRIRLRINNPAGFEANTRIYINPVAPDQLRDQVVKSLQKLRQQGEINSNLKIGLEIGFKPNKLEYILSQQ